MIRHTPLDRLLHRLALHSHRFRKFCFRRECERNGRRFDRHRKHVFIAGMARSGSTALLNSIHASGVFAATTYQLMPFVLAPSLSSIVASLSKVSTTPLPRRHGDSLQVGPLSPEALDGLFWNTYLPSDESPLRPREVPQHVVEAYAMFIENTLRHYGCERYLSKMNQGMALLPGLVPWFDRARFLVPFREPLQQAASLLRQQLRFAHLDSYETRYLEWLEHREFGATHRAFTAGDETRRAASEPTRLDYWLEQWRNGYSFLAQLADGEARVQPVAYEQLAGSCEVWQRLSKSLDVELDGSAFVNRNDESLVVDGVDPALLQECQQVYRHLTTLAEARRC